jgi:hypothetical protein
MPGEINKLTSLADGLLSELVEPKKIVKPYCEKTSHSLLLKNTRYNKILIEGRKDVSIRGYAPQAI